MLEAIMDAMAYNMFDVKLLLGLTVAGFILWDLKIEGRRGVERAR